MWLQEAMNMLETTAELRLMLRKAALNMEDIHSRLSTFRVHILCQRTALKNFMYVKV